MPEQRDTYKKLNDVEIMGLRLISDQGGETDISDICLSVNIYEDIFSPVLSGYLYIKDSINLIEHFPIVGQETIELKFRTPGIGSTILTVNFEVYSITDRIRAKNEKGEVYRLNLISKNYRVSELQRIKKSMVGKISDMAEGIFKEYFEPNVGYHIQKTNNEYKLIIPNLSPIETLRYLSTMAVSDSLKRDSSYVLFESIDSNFKFVSINRLSSGKTHRKYTMKPTGIRDGKKDLLDQMFNVQDFEYEKGFNRLEDMKNSEYSSTLITHDLVSKKINKYHYTYGNNFNQSSHVEKFKTLPSKNRYDGYLNNNITLKSTHKNIHNSHPETQDYSNWFQSRKSNLGMFDFNKIKIRVAGDSRMRVGMVVEIDIPTNEPVGANDSDWKKKIDSGRYLVTAVRHIITMGSLREHECVLELSRDSYPVQISDESTFLGSSNKSADGENQYFEE